MKEHCQSRPQRRPLKQTHETPHGAAVVPNPYSEGRQPLDASITPEQANLVSLGEQPARGSLKNGVVGRIKVIEPDAVKADVDPHVAVLDTLEGVQSHAAARCDHARSGLGGWHPAGIVAEGEVLKADIADIGDVVESPLGLPRGS